MPTFDLGRFRLEDYIAPEEGFPAAGNQLRTRVGNILAADLLLHPGERVHPSIRAFKPLARPGDEDQLYLLGSDLADAAYPSYLSDAARRGEEPGRFSMRNKDLVDTIARINTGKPVVGAVNPFLGGPKVVGGLNPYLGGPKILGGGKPSFESPFPVLPSGPRKPTESLPFFGKKPKKLSPEEMRFLLQLKTHRYNKETGQYEPREQDRGAIGGQTVFGIDVQPKLKNKLFNRKLTKLAAQLGHTYGEPASDLFGDVVQRYRARDPYSVLGVSPWSGEDLAKSLRAQLGGTVKLPSGESQAVDSQIMRWFQDKLGAEPITPNSVGERSWDWMVDRLFRGQQN